MERFSARHGRAMGNGHGCPSGASFRAAKKPYTNLPEEPLLSNVDTPTAGEETSRPKRPLRSVNRVLRGET